MLAAESELAETYGLDFMQSFTFRGEGKNVGYIPPVYIPFFLLS